VKIAIVGAGVLGTSLAMLLQRSGHSLVALCSRTKKKTKSAAAHLQGKVEVVGDPGLAAMGADLVLLAVPDREIEGVAAQVVGGGALRRGAVVAHFAGGLPSSLLDAVHSVGALRGALHPLQTFADVDTAVRLLPETYFSVEGDPEAVDVLRALVVGIGGHVVTLSAEKKALYHAGAVAASNFVVTLVDFAVGLLVQAGVPHGEALPALLPLLRGTVANLEVVGLPGALTGPIARGDTLTLERHMEALRKAPGDLVRLYRELARKNVELALRKGTVDKAMAQRILDVLAEDDLPGARPQAAT
jgi:predicted short-subunit dehydrogenase-like oxidoreductase (DUF2520 family)